VSWYWTVISIIVLLIISLALNVVFLFRFIWKDNSSKSRQIAQNASLSLFSFLIILILLELFFKVGFAQSDGFNYTLASKNWFERYWRSNSLGYRDIEWTPELLEDRTKIMVLGDSFVAGHGINNAEDRFPDLLGQMLGETYAVMNVGSNGANTKSEIGNALAYPYVPDMIILSFYINDIQETAQDMGFGLGPVKTGEPAVLKPLIEESYALNFLYWRLYRLGPQEWSEKYWNWLLSLYDNPDIWQIYQSELLQIYHFIKARNGQLIVVVFPNILAIDESRPITSQVVNLYAEQGVPVVDVPELIEGMDPQQLVVNSVDPHPNEIVHRLVAEELYQIILDNQ
jgi:lysophospholipase L1-like esterase